MANKKYIVGDQGYLRKAGKVYQTGQEITLTEKEYENVKDKVVGRGTEEAEELQDIQTDDKQVEEKKDTKKSK